MSLDLGETITQLDRLSESLGRNRDDRRARLARLLADASDVSPVVARERTRQFHEPFLAAQVVDTLLGDIPPLPAPSDWIAASVDGSHIDVDRHLPVACYLLNLGGCVLTYGSSHNAEFFSSPHLAAGPEDLYLRNPEAARGRGSGHRQSAWVAPDRQGTVHPVGCGADCPRDLPVLALVDGTLVLWGLAGHGYRDFVRDHIINDGLLRALDGFRQLAEERPVTLAAYVSLPRSAEVANAIRRCLCTYDMEHCRVSCSNRRSDREPCSNSNEFLDREIFGDLLQPYSRSPLFLTNSSVSRLFYGDEQQVCFYYLNAGEEIARVEVPRWVARDETLLSLGHTLIAEQCRKGQGYPVAISEAHEQAVVTGRDRQLFRQMVEETLERQGLPTYTSQKERSKQRPWV